MIEIIPAIDLIEGKCVRLSQGDFDRKTIYSVDPLTVAKSFEDAGLKRLHIVDLDGANNGSITNHAILQSIASHTDLIIDMGGGVRSEKDVQLLIDSGAQFISVGSIAYKNASLFKEWIEQFGADRFLLGADVKDERIAINGWKDITETSVYDFIETYTSIGVNHIFCTDIATDGMLSGPSIGLYEKILLRESSINLIASGGVSSIDDVYGLDSIGCSGVIIGKAIYEGRIALSELTQFISSRTN